MRALPSFLVALFLVGCGDSTSTSGPPTDSSTDGTSGGPNACTKAGGFCGSSAPCPAGYHKDDGALSCPAGDGLGIMNQPCCLPGAVQPPRPTDYSSKCTVDADCELIDDSTDPCCPGCLSGAIAKSDDAKYKSDLASFRSTCSSAAPCPGRGCATYVARCIGGSCQAVGSGVDAGADAPEGG